jgi:TolA-binding protein
VKYLLLIYILFYSGIYAQMFVDKYQVASEYYNDASYAEAYTIFMDLYNDNTADKEIKSSALYYASVCLINVGQTEGAIGSFESFLSEYKMSNFREDALYKLGTIYYENGQYRKCRDKLFLLITENPLTSYAGNSYYWIGKSYAEDNNFLDAEEFLEKSLSDSYRNSYVDYTLYSLATLYEEQEDYQNAVKYYDELLGYYRDSNLAPYARLRIGVCYFRLEEYDSAILELSDPNINQLPNDLIDEATLILATTFFRLKEYDNSAATYRRLLEKYDVADDQREVEYGLGLVSFQMRNYDEAFVIFDRLVKSGNDSIAVNSLYWGAECQRYSGDIKTATESYENFIESYPSSKLTGDAKFSLGIIYFENGKYKSAESYLIEATSSKDRDTRSNAYILLGEMNLKKNNFKGAKGNFEYALNSSLVNSDSRNRAGLGLGVSNYYLKDYDAANSVLLELASRYQRFETGKVNFYIAESNFARGRWADAIKHYHRVDDSDPYVGRQALYGKAYAYFNMKDFANSAFYFGEYVRKYSNDSHYLDAKLRLADSQYGIKNFDKASEIYAEVFSKDKSALDNDFALYQYGQSLFNSGQSSDAIEKFNDLQKRFPRSRYADESQYLIGWIKFQQNDFKGAIAEYEELFIKYPSSSIKPIAVYNIGDSYYNLGEYDSSLTYYFKLIEDYPNTKYVFDAISGIQYCYLAKDQPEQAVEVIDDYVNNNSSSEYADEILLKKGEIYYSLTDYENAKVSYSQLIAEYPESPYVAEAYYWIGKSASNLEQEEEAIRSFITVYESYLTSKYGVDAVLELGSIYTNRKNYTASVQIYSDASKKMDNIQRMPEVLYQKALAQIELGQIPAAYESFEDIIMYYKGSIFADKSKIELGILEMSRGEYARAEELFMTLGETRLDDIGAQAQFLYGVVLYEQNKINDAISALVRVRSVFSAYGIWYSRSLIQLGDCYAKLNDKKNAREMYRAVIKNHPKDELGAEARRKLNDL